MVTRLMATWLASLAGAPLTMVVVMMLAPPAHAVPSMARQTGMQCAACHTVFPELTSFGRQFKLRGFSMRTLEQKEDSLFGKVPISFLLQASRTHTSKTNTEGATEENFPRDRETIVQAAGLYYGGKITDKSGALIQYFYDGIERKWMMEMFDIRYANSTTIGSELIYGFTLSNNPTVTDIFSSTPLWNFSLETPALKPTASTLVDLNLASKVGGPGAYVMWNNMLYGEFALYRTTKTGVFRPLGWGAGKDPLVKGYAPYWRLALTREWGPHTFMAGTYGLVAKLHSDPEDAGSPTDRFRDVALDGQYHFMSGDHIVSSHITWIREKQDLDGSLSAGAASNASNTLQTLRADVHYWYNRRWGGGIQYFDTRGDTDELRYNTGAAVMGSANGSPNSKGWIAELNFLPRQDIKLVLRYTAFREFNGAKSNYDGFGRDARNNNNIFLLAWFLF